ncbi:hypothetical protein EUGRSUZ_K03369 [Eucalyptus grandis]|uniref:Uncharacterized protein n=2 Tax=Eucalyptus grandis TaxID=71139 RepID=A0ACC3IZI1_EUCGR|nr:hypothetical protein EUGRSUZ_K03369 [Eucalyptus grandis]
MVIREARSTLLSLIVYVGSRGSSNLLIILFFFFKKINLFSLKVNSLKRNIDIKAKILIQFSGFHYSYVMREYFRREFA